VVLCRAPPIRIVPLVVGSFHDATLLGVAPAFDDVGRMIERCGAWSDTKEDLLSDQRRLAHIGPKFRRGRRPWPRTSWPQRSARTRPSWRAWKTPTWRATSTSWPRKRDVRAICGYPPSYVVLDAARPRRGKVFALRPLRAPMGFESVSFASMAFYR